ncbi:J domain-containing protein [Ramlibacter humi]|nr:J domain-containing protein [Ramlibacter humi]
MSKTGTFYDVLQLRPGAAADDVRKAYRRLARENHPDAGASDSEAMALINQAYETLSSPEKRADYDRELTRPAGPGRRPGRVELPGDRLKRRALWAGVAVAVLAAAGGAAYAMWLDEPEPQAPPTVKTAKPASPAEPGLRLTPSHQLASWPAAKGAPRQP